MATLEDLYYSELGRAPDEEGLAYWQGQLDSGMSMDHIERSFAQSDEAARAVEQIYGGGTGTGGVLGREADVAGREYWQNRLGEQGFGLQDVYDSIQKSDEAINYRQNLAANQQLEQSVQEGGDYGLSAAADEYERALALSQQGLGRMSQTLAPFASGGTEAFNVQAALSGALGAEAQKEAFANYQASPEYQFLQEQGEKATMRNAAALGGLGGGNVQKELSRYNQQLAAQDYGNYFNRLSDTARTGGQAASQLASGQLNAGQTGANILTGMGGLRWGAGQALSGNIGQMTQGMANLQSQQGINDANIYGTGTTNVANQIGQTGQLMSQIPLSVSEYLGGIAQNQGANIATLYGKQAPGAGTAKTGTMDALAGGVSGVIEAIQ